MAEDTSPKMPAWATKEGQDRLRAYQCALGRFIDMFAKVEVAMQMVLWHYSQAPQKTARAAFGPVRIDGAVASLRRILSARKDIDETIADDLRSVMAQMLLINKARNLILHHGAISIEEGAGLVTNAPLAYAESAINSFPISPQILEAMFADLRRMMMHLLLRHLQHPAFAGGDYSATFRAAWLYIPPQQQTSRRADRKETGRPGRNRRRQPPPTASQE